MEAKIHVEGESFQHFGKCEEKEGGMFHLYIANNDNRISVFLDKKNVETLASLLSHFPDLKQKGDSVTIGYGGDINEQLSGEADTVDIRG